jgi:uncharacterized protein
MSTGGITLDLGRLDAGETHQEGTAAFAIRDAAGDEERHTVRVISTLDPLGPGVHVRCHIVGGAESKCHRCLKPFQREVDARFEFVLQRGGTSPGDDVVVVAETALEFDLTPLVRESLILEEPIRVLCRAECAGLCAQCGQDQNEGSCDCAPPEDPRWDELRRLSEKMKNR